MPTAVDTLMNMLNNVNSQPHQQTVEQLVQKGQLVLASPGQFIIQGVNRGGIGIVCPSMPVNIPCFVLFVSDNCAHCGPTLSSLINVMGKQTLYVVNINRDRTLHSHLPEVTHFKVTVTPTMQLFLNGEARVHKMPTELAESFLHTGEQALLNDIRSFGTLRQIQQPEPNPLPQITPDVSTQPAPERGRMSDEGSYPVQGNPGLHTLSGPHMQDHYVSDTAQAHTRDVKRIY